MMTAVEFVAMANEILRRWPTADLSRDGHGNLLIWTDDGRWVGRVNLALGEIVIENGGLNGA